MCESRGLHAVALEHNTQTSVASSCGMGSSKKNGRTKWQNERVNASLTMTMTTLIERGSYNTSARHLGPVGMRDGVMTPRKIGKSD